LEGKKEVEGERSGNIEELGNDREDLVGSEGGGGIGEVVGGGGGSGKVVGGMEGRWRLFP
jgi:hypothetical protein